MQSRCDQYQEKRRALAVLRNRIYGQSGFPAVCAGSRAAYLEIHSDPTFQNPERRATAATGSAPA